MKLKNLDQKRRTFIGSAVKAIDSDARTIRAYASTNAWDRYGERFEADAFKDGLANFKKNPVILFAHDYGAAPIAKAVGFEFDSKGLILTMKFADTDKAKEIFSLYEGGFMSAFSVGFRPLEVGFEERIAGSGEMGAVFKKAELLENSAVPVPANPEAVVMKGLGSNSMAMPEDLVRSVFAAAYRMGAPLVPGRADEGPVTGEPETPAADPAPAEPAAPVEPVAAPETSPEAVQEPAAEAPAADPTPAEAPKSLKEAVGYLLTLGKAAREKGKVDDQAVRSLLVQAVNLCRELVLGAGSQSLDGLDPESDGLSEEDAAMLKEFEIMSDKLISSGKASPKDLQELRDLGKSIEEALSKK